MKTFLEYVADDICQKYGNDLSEIAIVFPNKRASLFLNSYFAQKADKPIWSPTYITISELFRSQSMLKVADNIKLICDLYKSFIQYTGSSETLDQFYGWGQLLLSDFDDIDKNMADADKVFANLRDMYELDDVSYLTEEQVSTLKKFFSNFDEEHSSELKKRFLNLWSHLSDIYHDYNQRLQEQGLAYEGALYREVATKRDVLSNYTTYIFVGFNLLQKVEQTLFTTLKEKGRAKFYWDFDHFYMPHDKNQHEAGFYISKLLQYFPNELNIQSASIYANFCKPKEITFITAATENLQARYISTWLKENNRINDGTKTAIILCNEQLLPTAIHCLPDEIEQINITTGYPLSQSPFYSLLNVLITLRATGYMPQSQKYRLSYVNAVVRHPYIQYVTPNVNILFQRLNIENRNYYPTAQQLSVDDGATLLFGDWIDTNAYPERILSWILDLLRVISQNAKEVSDPLFQESLFRTYTIINRLYGLVSSGDLTVDITTIQRLINQLIQTTSVPFHGEPAVGVQMMGILETRNIDFEHLLILSCNEGNVPKGINDSSFIPHSIRKAYELTTIDNKVAIYAYYFYRLLQRANDITFVYNNTANDSNTGEMSRFMLQLMVESPHHIQFKSLKAGQTVTTYPKRPIEKTPHVIHILRQRFDIQEQDQTDSQKPLLTPTAINQYLRCQLQFFYHYVCNIKEPDNNEEDLIDNRIFGNIFHEAANILYNQLCEKSHYIVRDDLEYILKTKVNIERAVDMAFKKELFHIREEQHALPELSGLGLINREVILYYLTQLVKTDIQLAPFTIIGLEKDVIRNVTINNKAFKMESTIGGRIDRLDMVTDESNNEHIRVIDYKTGRSLQSSLADIDKIFNSDNIKKHSDYYLQTFVYADIVRHEQQYNPQQLCVSPALLFIQHSGATDYNPILCLGKEVLKDIASVSEDFNNRLTTTLNEMFNPDIAFTPTEDSDICATCPYASLCGK